MNPYPHKTKNTVELTAVFQRENIVRNDNTPQRWIVGFVTQKQGACTKYIPITGECQEGDLRPNLEYRFAGMWKTHPRYGTSFAFDSFTQPEPITREAIVGYLTQCPKIGMMRAEKIYDSLGHDCIAQVKADADVLRTVSGLTDEDRSAIQTFLCGKEAKEKATLELQSLLKGLGFPRRIFAWLELDFGTAAATRIRENPFILTKYRGVGFELADKVYERLGLPPAGLLRQWNYLVYILTSETSGSTWMTEQNAAIKLNERFYGYAAYTPAFAEAESQGKIVRRTENNTFYIGLPHLAECEHTADWVFAHCQKPSCWAKELLCNGKDMPSEHQLQAYSDATKSAVGLLVGSPGTGKTWLVGRIIDTLQHNKATYAVCAPTGKAALRVMESLKWQGVEVMATTIHKLLGATMGSDGWEFMYNAECRLPYDFIIVDESSMIDIVMLKTLLDAVKDNANVLFVGDQEQLPPVGKGAPLRDMIKAGVPCGELTEIRRNAGEIVKACAAIRRNEPIAPMPQHFDSEENLIFCRMTPTKERTFEMVKSIIEYEKANNEKFDPLLDCQIIVPLNEKSPVSRKELNPLFQDYFNPHADAETKIRKFRKGDKIICTRNGWTDGIYVANGEICTVQDFTASQIHVLINGQPAAIPTYGDWGESEFDLGYCISGHKSQGSEWQVAMVVMDMAFGARMVCDKHWIYTALSRAKRRCYLIGLTDTLEAIKSKSLMWNRITLFAEQFEKSKTLPINLTESHA